jgi:hypothetical protein
MPVVGKTNSAMTHLDAYTYEELGLAMARVLARAGEEILSGSEVQRFWEIHDEIQRRSTPSGPDM